VSLDRKLNVNVIFLNVHLDLSCNAYPLSSYDTAIYNCPHMCPMFRSLHPLVQRNGATAQRRGATARRNGAEKRRRETAQRNGATAQRCAERVFTLGVSNILEFYRPFLGPLSIRLPRKNGATAQLSAAARRKGATAQRRNPAPFVLGVKGVTRLDIRAFKGKAQIRMYSDSSRNMYETDKRDHSGKITLALN